MRRSVRLMLVVLAMLLSLAACGIGDAPVDPKQVATDGAAAFDKVTSFHFKLVVTEGDAAPINEIILIEADGDSVRPDKVKAKLKAKLPGVPLAVNINGIIVGTDVWITENPFDPTKYTRQADTAGLQSFSPAKGVSDALLGLREASLVGKEDLGGVQTYHIRGKVDNASLTAITGGVATTGEVAMDLWIGVDDKLVRQVIVVGALDPSEKPTIKRTLTLSDFNKPVEIEAPPQ